MDYREHAANIASAYKTNEKVASIMIAGSVSRGWNDAFSDIEVYVFWKEAPTDEDRQSPIYQVDGQVMDYYPFEENEWSETYVAGGIKFEMSHFLVDYIDEIITTVVTEFDTDKDKQCLVAGIQDGIILFGEEVADVFKKRVNQYPTELGKQVVIENLEFSSRWNSRYVLAEREDFFILYDVLNDTIGKVLEILHGVNRMYIGHPRLKWVKQTVQQMEKTPRDLVQRLREIYKKPNVQAIENLENIILETYEIVAETYPKIDIIALKEKMLVTRPTLS